MRPPAGLHARDSAFAERADGYGYDIVEPQWRQLIDEVVEQALRLPHLRD